MDKLSPDIVESIKKGIDHLQIALTEKQIEQLTTYLMLLLKWNDTYNLTAIRSPQKMVSHHILDALAVVPFLSTAQNILDVGSGAGIPGIILAIACPEKAISLIDTVQKKTAFLVQVKLNLGLTNVTVYTGHVENLPKIEKFDLIISRAFSDLQRFISLSKKLLKKSGTFLAMKGQLPQKEIEQLTDHWQVNKICPLIIPGLEEERNLIFIQLK